MRHLVVLPAFNEEAALPGTLAGLAALPPVYDIVVINDGSNDRTRFVAQQLGEQRSRVRVIHLPVNSGIGVAVQTGYRFAAEHGNYHCVIQFDADGQHDAAAIVPLVDWCVGHELDLCIGSRFLMDGERGFRSTGLRRIGIRFFAHLIGLLSGVHVTDPTSGLRCAGPRAWRRFAEIYPDDYPEPESLFWCARNGLHVGEMPVVMHERQGGTSSIYRFRAAYYMLKVTMSILFDRVRAREGRSV